MVNVQAKGPFSPRDVYQREPIIFRMREMYVHSNICDEEWNIDNGAQVKKKIGDEEPCELKNAFKAKPLRSCRHLIVDLEIRNGFCWCLYVATHVYNRRTQMYDIHS
jgi:hypothetical protein